MALRVGDSVPDFSMPGSDGDEHSSAKLLGRPYIVTFYPKDETLNCIRQVCALRDAWDDLQPTGVAVFGVSRDDVDTHKAFVAHRKLPYALLTDASGKAHKAFDVGRNFYKATNRVSYLVGRDGKIAAVYESNLFPQKHAEKMLEAARALVPSA